MVFNSRIDGTEIPSFTVCPKYQVSYKKDVLDKRYGISVSDVRNFNFPSNVHAGDFFQSVTHNLSDILKEIVIATKLKYPGTKYTVTRMKFNSSGISVPEAMESKVQKWFREINWHTFGRCFSFEIPLEIKLLKVLDKRF